MKKIHLLGLALLMAVLAVISCKKDKPETAFGTVNVRLTDAPAIYDSVNVEVLGVEIHSDQQGWVTFNAPAPGIYNLLDYRNGLDTLIASGTLPVGRISQLRLILGNNNTVTENGITHPLIIPSGATSGLKIQINQTIIQGVTTIIQLDFDASRSIVPQGNGTYHLRPVMRSLVQGIDGSIKGAVNPAVQALVQAINGTDTFTTTTSLNGNFLISAVPPGTYTVCFTPVAPYNAQCINNVVVTQNNQTDMGTINL